jgi:hypothetical protein
MFIKEEDKRSPKIEDSENKKLLKVEESKGSLKLELNGRSDQPEGCSQKLVDIKEEAKQQPQVKAKADEPMVRICRKLVFPCYGPYSAADHRQPGC